jgi:hypothetical protein
VSHPVRPRAVAPPLRRGAGRVQLGVGGEQSVVLEGLTDEELTALEALDGVSPVPAGLRTSTGRELLAGLTALGLVVEGPAPAHPGPQAASHATVLVVGRGPAPQAVAAQLRRSGVGHVEQGAFADALGARPDLVVLTAAHAVDHVRAEPFLRRGIPVVPFVAHADEVVVGPVVRRGGPCLRCLDLTRADLDPAWPVLLGQLTGSGVGPGPVVTVAPALVDLAAALVTTIAMAVLGGGRLPPGRALEVGTPWPSVRQREWPAHPRCSCAGTRIAPSPDTVTTSSARMAG